MIVEQKSSDLSKLEVSAVSNGMETQKRKIDDLWRFVRERLFFEPTNLIYDHVIDDLAYFPTTDEALSNFPNPCGYGTGMEDSMINGSSMLLACLGRYQAERDEEAKALAHRLVAGILNCQSKAKTIGFLPRSLTPCDGESHYVDSSRDQYTLCVYAMCQYYRSELATVEERAGIKRMLVSFAIRAEQNVTVENRYDLLREDGLPSVCSVMWGETLGNHEYLRLPMIYLAAWSVSGDAHWLEFYRAIRAEAVACSLPMTGRYWHLYTLQQMQMSARLCYDLDPDDGWKEEYGKILSAVAHYVTDHTEETLEALRSRDDYNAPFRSFHEVPLAPRRGEAPDGGPNLSPVRAEYHAFFILQDAVDTLNVVNLCPDVAPSESVVALYLQALERMDSSKHVTSVPVQALEAYYPVLY